MSYPSLLRIFGCCVIIAEAQSSKLESPKKSVPADHQAAYWKADRDVLVLEAIISAGREAAARAALAEKQLPDAQKIRTTTSETISKDCGGNPIINAAGLIDCAETKSAEPKA